MANSVLYGALEDDSVDTQLTTVSNVRGTNAYLVCDGPDPIEFTIKNANKPNVTFTLKINEVTREPFRFSRGLAYQATTGTSAFRLFYAQDVSQGKLYKSIENDSVTTTPVTVVTSGINGYLICDGDDPLQVTIKNIGKPDTTFTLMKDEATREPFRFTSGITYQAQTGTTSMRMMYREP